MVAMVPKDGSEPKQRRGSVRPGEDDVQRADRFERLYKETLDQAPGAPLGLANCAVRSARRCTASATSSSS